MKKVFLEISQNSQENTSARVSFLNKVAVVRPATLLKKRLWPRCFPGNFVKFVRNLTKKTSDGCFWRLWNHYLNEHRDKLARDKIERIDRAV